MSLQPQPNEVAAPLGFLEVHERRAIVQQPAVVEKEYLPGLQGKLHTQVGAAERFVERIQRASLGQCERNAGF